MEEENLSIEDIELDDGEKPIDRLRRSMPGMADFIQAYKDEMKPPALGGIAVPEWIPVKLEFYCEQWQIGTESLTNGITTMLNDGWTISQSQTHKKYLLVIFSRPKVDKVDSSLDSQ